MASQPLSEQQQRLADELTEVLRPRLEQTLREVAALLASTANSHPFGPTEFALRDVIQTTAADLITTALREKKRLPRIIASVSRLPKSR